MAYTAELMRLIRVVEATRSERISGGPPPKLSYEERAELLRTYHPDFNRDAYRILRVGPNRGDPTVGQIADELEAHSRLNPDSHNLKTDLEVDVLVVGGGGTGAAALLVAHECGAQAILATKLRLGDSNTIMAQGGVAAATMPDDSPACHFLDSIGGGRFSNDRALLKVLVREAPGVILWLERLGVMWDKTPQGMLRPKIGGGMSRARVHPAGDQTGMEIIRVLRDEIWNRRIQVLEFSPAIELLTDEAGRCRGAVLQSLETGELVVIGAKTVVLATGGCGRLHPQGFPTTNHYGATADGLAIAYRAGARLRDMDALQYHPKGAAFPEQIVGQLVSDIMSSGGAHFVNVEGQRFVNELEARDTLVAAIVRECRRGKGVKTPQGRDAVWLDTPVLEHVYGEGTTRSQLRVMYRTFQRQGIDPSKYPVLIYPTFHYQNGGLEIDISCETTVPNLFAGGEVAGGVHGKNRLLGNSLLDTLVFGRRAGEMATERARSVRAGRVGLGHLRRHESELEKAGVVTDRVSPRLLPDYRHGKDLGRR